MGKKEEFTAHARESFDGEARKLMLAQIERFYSCNVKASHSYSVGDTVKLSRGTFLHGIPGMHVDLSAFDWVVENGFTPVDMTRKTTTHKIKNSVGVWNLRKDCTLGEYVRQYSGVTLTYSIGRGPGCTDCTILVPYRKFDEVTEELMSDERIWTYRAECTKEVRFMPSLVSPKVQIGFILDVTSPEAKEMASHDVWDTSLSPDILKYFLDERFYEKFLTLRYNRNAATTDRESAVIFGLPSCLIAGVLVGRETENDRGALDYIKKRLPGRYICSLDGIVIDL